LAAVCVTAFCSLLCVTAFCWLLSVSQPSVGCCLCHSLLFTAVCVTAFFSLLSVSRRQTWSGNSLLMLRCAERLSLWSDEWKFIGFLSKLAFKGGFCVQKIDGVLLWWRLHRYMHVICRRWFFCSTLKR